MRHPEYQEVGMYYKKKFLFWHKYYAYTGSCWHEPGVMYDDPQNPVVKTAFTAKRAVKKARDRRERWVRQKEEEARPVKVYHD